MSPSILPKLGKMAKGQQKQGIGVANTNPDLNPIYHFWAELKKHVREKRPTNLTQLHQLCQEEWAKMYPIYCGKLVEGYPKCLTQVKLFKGSATKYSFSVCKLLTN